MLIVGDTWIALRPINLHPRGLLPQRHTGIPLGTIHLYRR